MLIAYMVIANFRMKMSGLREKDAFYTAERALEEIRTGLQEDVAEAMSEAYTNVMESYNENVKTGDVTMDVQRQAAYEREFLSILQTRLRVSNTNNTHYNIAKLREYVDLDKEDSFDSEKESLIVTAAADGESSSSSAVADREKYYNKESESDVCGCQRLCGNYPDEYPARCAANPVSDPVHVTGSYEHDRCCRKGNLLCIGQCDRYTDRR